VIVPPPVNFGELERKINCPNCGRLMSTHLYGGPGNLVVDNCIHCNQLWLDHTEFRRVVRAPGREPFPKTDEDDQ
jgi:Zn-finger nucleic acid-binding protein